MTKQRLALAWTASVLAGCGLHFLYVWLPLPLVALFAPVSESVWEHLKLLYWPFLAAAAVLCRRLPLRAWSGFLLSLLVQPLVLTGGYYLLLAGFGVSGLWVDIALYAAVLAGGFWLARQVSRSGRGQRSLGLLIVLAALYGVTLMVFSLAAPRLPIFVG